MTFPNYVMSESYKLSTLRYLIWAFYPLVRRLMITSTYTWKIYTLLHFAPHLLECLKLHTMFRARWLIDLTAVDYAGSLHRFHIHYFFLSLVYNVRFQVITAVREWWPIISIVYLYESAFWLERELYDMFGIRCAGHPRLTRILTDYGFKAWPLRKNFPLSGYKEVHYNEVNKGVIYERVELMQEFRRYEMSFYSTKPPYIYTYHESAESRPKHATITFN